MCVHKCNWILTLLLLTLQMFTFCITATAMTSNIAFTMHTAWNLSSSCNGYHSERVYVPVLDTLISFRNSLYLFIYLWKWLFSFWSKIPTHTKHLDFALFRFNALFGRWGWLLLVRDTKIKRHLNTASWLARAAPRARSNQTAEIPRHAAREVLRKPVRYFVYDYFIVTNGPSSTQLGIGYLWSG